MKKLLGLLAIFCFFVVSVLFAPKALAKDVTTQSDVMPPVVYVDDEYTSESAGGHTWGYDAFATVSAGITAVAASGTVNVAAGEYTEIVSIDKSINLLGAGKATTKITGLTGYDSVIKISTENSATSPVTISGFTIDASNFPYGGEWENGIHIFTSDYVTIEQNSIINVKGDGIFISDNSNNNTVKKNTITCSADGCTSGVNIYLNSGSNIIGGTVAGDANTISLPTSGIGNLYGISLSGANSETNTIEHNAIDGGKRAVQQDVLSIGTTTISDNNIGSTLAPAAFGINIAGGTAIISTNTLKDTVKPIEFWGDTLTASDNTINGATSYGICPHDYSGTVTIHGNTIYNIASHAIYANGTGLTITDNIIHDVTGYGIELLSASIGAVVDGNEVYNVSGYAAIVVEGTGTAGATGSKINNNYIHNNTQGGAAVNAQNSEFNNNRIIANGWGIEMGNSASFALHYNNITGNCPTHSCAAVGNMGGLAVYGGGTVNAENNWWGNATGPYNNPDNLSGTGDVVGLEDTGTVDFTPWLTNAITAKAITAFSLPGQVGETTINESAKTIALNMPFGTTTAVATFTATGASVKVGSTVQVSGTTENDFTSAVTYRVTASDATYVDYVVTVTVNTNAIPASSSVTIKQGATPTPVESITLIEDTTASVVVTATVTDGNGYADITSVQAKLYRSGVAGGAGATDNANNHYTLAGDENCIPSGGSDNTETYTCTFPVYFYADPTDAGTYSAENWVAQVIPSDAGGAGTKGTDDTAEMATMVGIDATSSIDYGDLAMGANTGTVDKTTTVENTGNVSFTTGVDGYGLADTDGYSMTCTTGTVAVGLEKYDTSPSTAYGSKTQLSDTNASLITGSTIAKSTNGTPLTDIIYWGFGMPDTGVLGTCTGKVVFTGVPPS